MESSSTATDDDFDDGLIRSRKSLYFSACLNSPCSIVPAHHHNQQLVTSGGVGVEYSRIRRQLHSGAREGEDRWSCCRNKSRHLWRMIVRKLLKESKCLYGSSKNSKKQLTFRYDAVSYKQNFDDGSHRSEEDRLRYVVDSRLFDRKDRG